ncbi:MAG: hypothetical protein J7513_09935 [Solirubrobacteraceae bacterium]|nr:hypothetical protein [Solirubrobacteraceae bacterium]
MRIVDYSTQPDGPEHREALVGAFDGIALEDGEPTEPSAPSATCALAFPAALGDDEIRVQADRIRKRIVHVLGDEATDISWSLAPGGDDAGR